MSIDKFFDKKYNESQYNCVHFVCDVWQHLTGSDISSQLEGFMLPPQERYVNRNGRKSFTEMDKPISPCIVHAKNRNQSHVGVFYNGRILHIQETHVAFQKLDAFKMGFTRLRFYKC